jgi:hypothetical protein
LVLKGNRATLERLGQKALQVYLVREASLENLAKLVNGVQLEIQDQLVRPGFKVKRVLLESVASLAWMAHWDLLVRLDQRDHLAMSEIRDLREMPEGLELLVYKVFGVLRVYQAMMGVKVAWESRESLELMVNQANRDLRDSRVLQDFKAHRVNEDQVVSQVKMGPLVLWDHRVPPESVDAMASQGLLVPLDPRVAWARPDPSVKEECLDFRACKDCLVWRASRASLVS